MPMNKRAVVIIAVLALFVGAVAGGWSVAAIYSHRTNRLIRDYEYHENKERFASLTADADTRVYSLSHLHAGQTTNVIEFERGVLEGDLINLESFVTDRSDYMSYPPCIHALQDVKAYRTEFPYEEPPSVEKSVEEVFTLLDRQTNR
jgi:hypothetical protein